MYGNSTYPSLAPPAANTAVNRYGVAPGRPHAGGGGYSIIKIADLSLYQSTWGVQARVVSKSGIRTFNGARGEGRVMSVTIDDGTGRLRCSLFSEAIEKFEAMLQERRTYVFAKGKLKNADPKWSQGAKFEVTFDQYADITPCDDPAGGPPPLAPYNFVPMRDVLERTPVGSNVDLAAVMRRVDAEKQFTSKAGKPLRKREVTLGDETGATIDFTIWGYDIDKYGAQLQAGTVIFIRNAEVREFQSQRQLGMKAGSEMDLVQANEHQRAAQLVQWWQAHGAAQPLAPKQFTNTGVRGPFVTAEHVLKEQSGYHCVRQAIITHIPHDRMPWYLSCCELKPDGTPCQKKATERPDGGYDCPEGHRPQNPTLRYIGSFKLSDVTGTLDTKAFNDVTTKMLGGKTADAMHQLQIGGDMGAAFEKAFVDSTYKYWNIKVAVKVDNFRDQENLKREIVAAEPVQFPVAAQEMLTELRGKFPW
jgi:replication factor A1